MRKLAGLTLLTLFCSYTSADIFYQPKIGLEYINYELQVANSEIPAVATIPAISLGATIIHSSNWYLDFDFSFGQGEVTDFYPEDDYIDHGALTLSIGKSIGNHYTVYGGYNNAARLIKNNKGQVGQGDSAEFNSDGIFLGLAKSFPLNKKSRINLAGAIGSMAGTYRLHLAEAHYSVNGDAIGYSGSAAYSYQVSKVTSLTTGAKIQSYNYTGMKDRLSGAEFNDTEESMISLFAKLTHTF